ncbi:MAG: hypothetical protein ACKVOU_13190 [Cytophagales bacterium]
MAEAYQLPFLIHEEVRKELSQERATKTADLLEKSIDAVFSSAKEIDVQKKLELRDELSKELASKADLLVLKSDIKGEMADLKAELKTEMAELRAEIKVARSETRVYFVVLLCVIIILNKDFLSFIAQILGLIK